MYSIMDQVKSVKYNLSKLEVVWSVQANHNTTSFLKAVFHKFYLVNS